MNLIIMCGLPFSGKTTLSKQIAEYTKSKRVSFDELWLELETDLKDKNDLSWDSVLGEAKRRVVEYLEEGESIVYDDTNARKEHRDALVGLAKAHQAQSQIVYLDIPKELVIERRHQNLTSQSRNDVEDENFNSVLSQFEKPGNDEGVIMFRPDDEVEEWLEDNLLR